MSGITTATRSSGRISSRSGALSIGFRTASRKAASSSGNPYTNAGAITDTFDDGMSTLSPSFPYFSSIFIGTRMRPSARVRRLCVAQRAGSSMRMWTARVTSTLGVAGMLSL